MYRPGYPMVAVASWNEASSDFNEIYYSTSGIGGYQTSSLDDRVVVFDYNGDGLSDLFYYRPGSDLAYVIRAEGDGTFSEAFGSTNGIGDYHISSTSDEAVSFDYNADGLGDIFLFGEL